MSEDIKRMMLERVAAAVAFVLGVGFSLLTMHAIEQAFVPVMEDWTVTQRIVDGQDIVLIGTVRKTRACEYIAPPRARTVEGVQLLVTSSNVAATTTWAPSDTPQRFGPWRVINGAGRRIEVYQVHRCHPLWLTFSQLGELAP